MIVRVCALIIVNDPRKIRTIYGASFPRLFPLAYAAAVALRMHILLPPTLSEELLT